MNFQLFFRIAMYIQTMIKTFLAKARLFFQNMRKDRRKMILAGVVMILVIVGLFRFHILGAKTTQQQLQTAQVEKGTIVSSVSASGQVSSTNSTTVTTQASGVVSKVYVADGDMVKAGDKIADITLDTKGQQNASQAYASYQSAQSSLASEKAKQYSVQATMFSNWDTFMTLATNGTYTRSDGSPDDTNRSAPQFHIAQGNWLASEANFKNEQSLINAAQTSLNSAWYSYLESSPTITAPIDGKITGLSLQEGTIVGSTSSTSSSSSTGSTTSTNTSSTKIANVITDAAPTISVSLAETDMPKVKLGNKATITFDAFGDKTYTGSVISVDTVGSVSSGVSTYPAVIKLDSVPESLYPNMSATANIISQTKTDVLLVPSAAVQTQSGQSTVRVMKNGQVTSIPVETGLSSDSQTEIVSGLFEGDEVVIGSTAQTNSSSSNTRSPFSGSVFGGGVRTGGFGGGNAVRGTRGQ